MDSSSISPERKHIDKLQSRQASKQRTAANERVNKQMYLCIGEI